MHVKLCLILQCKEIHHQVIVIALPGTARHIMQDEDNLLAPETRLERPNIQALQFCNYMCCAVGGF